MPSDRQQEVPTPGSVRITVRTPAHRLPWESVCQILREAGYRCSISESQPKDSPQWNLHRSTEALRREGHRITYQSGSDKVMWTVDIEGADEGAIDHFLNRVFGLNSSAELSVFDRLNTAAATDYGPCFNLGRLIWAGRPLAANRPLRRLLWTLRYRLPHFRRWVVDPIVAPELRRSAETLCAAALLGGLDPARIKKALVEIEEIGNAEEDRPYAEWRAALQEVWSQLSERTSAPPPAPTNPRASAIEAMQKARDAIATALAALDSI